MLSWTAILETLSCSFPFFLTSLQFLVEAVLGKRLTRGKAQYRIKWVGCKKSAWEPEEACEGCRGLIQHFEKSMAREKTAKTRMTRTARSSAGSKRERVSDSEFEVEAILGERVGGAGFREYREYLLKWKDWPKSQAFWQLESDCNCQRLIDTWRKTTSKRTRNARAK